ncbi:hypothetical protein QBC44DRAFT_373834 [Cladorrhinum sp. PSN332]|nr:hypothetical protein QBC44DRAFT_373834 [Cladorrhinum sp. PSN332]
MAGPGPGPEPAPATAPIPALGPGFDPEAHLSDGNAPPPWNTNTTLHLFETLPNPSKGGQEAELRKIAFDQLKKVYAPRPSSTAAAKAARIEAAKATQQAADAAATALAAGPQPAPAPWLVPPGLPVPAGNRVDDISNAKQAGSWVDVRFRAIDSWTMGLAHKLCTDKIRKMRHQEPLQIPGAGRHWTSLAVNDFIHGGDVFTDSRLVLQDGILRQRYSHWAYQWFRTIYSAAYGGIPAASASAMYNIMWRIKYSTTPMPHGDLLQEHENFINQYVSNYAAYCDRIKAIFDANECNRGQNKIALWGENEKKIMQNTLDGPERAWCKYMNAFANLCSVYDTLVHPAANPKGLPTQLTDLAKLRQDVFDACNTHWVATPFCANNDPNLFIVRWPNPDPATQQRPNWQPHTIRPPKTNWQKVTFEWPASRHLEQSYFGKAP